MDQFLVDFNGFTNANYHKLQDGMPGLGTTYFKMPNDWIKIGEYQYLPLDALDPEHHLEIIETEISSLEQNSFTELSAY